MLTGEFFCTYGKFIQTFACYSSLIAFALHGALWAWLNGNRLIFLNLAKSGVFLNKCWYAQNPDKRSTVRVCECESEREHTPVSSEGENDLCAGGEHDEGNPHLWAAK